MAVSTAAFHGSRNTLRCCSNFQSHAWNYITALFYFLRVLASFKGESKLALH